MSGAVTAIATAASAAAANTVGLFTISSAAIDAASTIGYTAATIGVTTGISAAIGAAFAPKAPDPQALQFPLKQPMPVRQSAFGRVRVAGAYALYVTGTTHTNISYDVLALLDGQSSAIVGFYLNDDLMAKTASGNFWWAPGAPGKYGGGGSNEPNLVKIDSRLGLSTETAYAISSDVPVWTSDHRGDGVTSMLLTCTQAKREDQAGDFPNGLPQPSAVIDAQLIFDPRDVSQTQGDPSTYKFSDNPVLCLLAYLTDASGGMGLDYGRFILPAIDFWTAAADECDGLVSTSGMHATLLDAAAAGDNKIFLADTTGLTAGVVIQLADGQNVTVSGLGLAGEVDLTGTLTNSHTAGELAYWNASGQSARYRCAGTYKHDTPPGDVVKSILQTFDGWLGQRGDGALVVRTNTVYAPTVTLSDRHIVGYQLQNYLPDEQATNQYIVSYTDPASAFNKAEAGYVQDDIDIAARGDVRNNELYLQWVPSAPQAISVARAMLARQTQPLRLTLTCNLAGLAVMGERYIRLDVLDPSLSAANGILEVTGKVSIDISTMTASFPCVVVGGYGSGANQAVCFILDVSKYGDASAVTRVKNGVINALSLIGATYGSGLDIAVVAFDHAVSSIVKPAATASDIADIITFVSALTMDADFSFDAASCLSEAKTFFDGTDPSILTKRIIMVWGGITDTTQTSSLWPTYLADAEAVIATMPGVRINSIDVEGHFGTTYTSHIDNTPEDGLPLALTAQAVTADIEVAMFGSVATAGAGYTLPPLAPPSGSPLQPLAAPTITSVTPVYPNSGGGVQGARLSIVVADPGGNITWKVQWKLSADSVWTDGGSSITATGSPLTILTGLIPATGSVDVQVAYIAGAQVSPWSSTTTVTVAAPVAGVMTLTASEAITAPALVNIWNSSGAAKVRNANASTSGKEAHGYVVTSVSSGGTATVYASGDVTGLSGLTAGEQYLAATAGQVTATAPTGTGQIVQRVGFAHSSTAMTFEPGDPVIRR
jgi:hypothetical protein